MASRQAANGGHWLPPLALDSPSHSHFDLDNRRLQAPHVDDAASTSDTMVESTHQSVQHPVPQMQGAFEESMFEMADTSVVAKENRYSKADKITRRKLLLENANYERTVAGRWVQKPGEKFHPLWKLISQISFGMHLLQSQMARSEDDVIKILQEHVDEIDGFLERTTEDFDLAQNDINERIKFLKLPLEHGDVFDTMLGDRAFRSAIVDGNEKIEHIVNRTTVAMKDSLKDVQKGLESTKELSRFLKDVDRTWSNRTEEQDAVYTAMLGNTEGWTGAYQMLQQKGSRLGISLVQLGGIISEIQRRAGVASRRNLPTRHPLSSRYASPSQTPMTTAPPSPMFLPTQRDFRTPRSAMTPTPEPNKPPKKSLPVVPSTVLAISRAAKASQAIELPVHGHARRKSSHALVVTDAAELDSRTPSMYGSNAISTASTRKHSRQPSLDKAKEEDPGPTTLSIPPIEENVEEERERPMPDAFVPLLQAPHQRHPSSTAPEVLSEPGRLAVDSRNGRSSHFGGSSTSTAELADLEELDEEDPVIVNHAHPLLQDIRAREVHMITPNMRPKLQTLSVKTSADTLQSRSGHASTSISRADPVPQLSRVNGTTLDRSSSTWSQGQQSEFSPINQNSRSSDNTLATPISLMSSSAPERTSGKLAPLHERGGSNGTKIAPHLEPATQPTIHSAPQVENPPSPSPADLMSATVSGPESDPFALLVAQKHKPPSQRHEDLIHRITTSISDIAPKLNGTHTSIVTNTSTSRYSGNMTHTTPASIGANNTFTSGPISTTTVFTRAAHHPPPQHQAREMASLQPSRATTPNPSSALSPINSNAVQLSPSRSPNLRRGLSPFPSTNPNFPPRTPTSEARAKELVAQMEANSKSSQASRKSSLTGGGFKRMFSRASLRVGRKTSARSKLDGKGED